MQHCLHTIKQITDLHRQYVFKLAIFLCLSWTQAAEVGWERETCHGATEKENGERGTENDEKRAEDCCQTFVTLIQRTGHSKQEPNNCSHYILPGYVLPTTLLSSPLRDIFLVHHPFWEFLFVCLFIWVFFLYRTEHSTKNRPFCLCVIVTVLTARSMKEKLDVFFCQYL